jgi:hypothetical protein
MEHNYTLIYSDVDEWNYILGSNYSSRKYYKCYFRNTDPPAPFIWIWKFIFWPKLNVFAWLLFSDRLNTRNMLKRRHYNIGNNFSCPFYNSGEEETLELLFFIAPLLLTVGTYCI